MISDADADLIRQYIDGELELPPIGGTPVDFPDVNGDGHVVAGDYHEFGTVFAGGAGTWATVASYEYTSPGLIPGGLVETVTDALGNVTRYQYGASGNNRGRLITVQGPEGTGTAFHYDKAGNVIRKIELIDASEQRITGFEYDDLDRLVKLIEPILNSSLSNTPSESEVIDPGVLPVTTYHYDRVGNLIEVHPPRFNNPSHDDFNNRATITIHRYDKRHRLDKTVFPTAMTDLVARSPAVDTTKLATWSGSKMPSIELLGMRMTARIV